MRHTVVLSTLQKLTNRKPKQREIAEALGCPVNTIGNRAVRNSEYSFDELLKICQYFKVDLLQDISPVSSCCNKNIAEPKVLIKDNEESIAINYFPDVFGSCGTGTFVLSEIKEEVVIPKKAIFSYNPNKTYSLINAYGDSMLPYIHDKDMLVVEHDNGETIIDNRIYVFRFGDNIFIKRLILNINELIIRSDNPEYKAITLLLSESPDIQVIGKVVGVLRRVD